MTPRPSKTQCVPPFTLVPLGLLGRNVRQAEKAKVAALALVHLKRGGRRMVVVTAQMQEAVDDIQGQLGVNVVAAVIGFGLGHLSPNDKLPGQSPGPWITQGKTQDVGRLIVTEITLVELMDRGIVNEGKADLRVGNALFAQHGANDFTHSATINRNQLLRTGDGNSLTGHTVFL